MLKVALEHVGFEVDVADNGEERSRSRVRVGPPSASSISICRGWTAGSLGIAAPAAGIQDPNDRIDEPRHAEDHARSHAAGFDVTWVKQVPPIEIEHTIRTCSPRDRTRLRGR
jgi:hypothetical protein